jgi:hypothetical protein
VAGGLDGVKGEKPEKLNDHGCDAMRYLVANQDLNPKKRFWSRRAASQEIARRASK